MSVAAAAPTRNPPPPIAPSTEHALLVPLGHFAAQLGVRAAFERVPIKMKTVAHSPGDKLGELLAHILAGGMHVRELAAGARPLVDDRAVAAAWARRRSPRPRG